MFVMKNVDQLHHVNHVDELVLVDHLIHKLLLIQLVLKQEVSQVYFKSLLFVYLITSFPDITDDLLEKAGKILLFSFRI
jgi:hypothetical protein